MPNALCAVRFRVRMQSCPIGMKLLRAANARALSDSVESEAL
jgi:hypothetical protein